MDGVKRRTRLDRLRSGYRRRVTTPAGRELIVRARRQIDAETLDPMAVPMPFILAALLAMRRELKNHGEFGNRWVVDVFPRFDSAKAQTLAVTTKRQALDLVDKHAQKLSETN